MFTRKHKLNGFVCRLQHPLHILLFILCVWGSEADGDAYRRGVEFGPDNVAALIGDDVVLRCRTDGMATSNIRWLEFTTNDVDGSIISDGNQLLPGNPNVARYQLIRNDSVTYDLKITSVVLEDAGFYLCQDSNANPPNILKLGAQLVALASDPSCQTTLPGDGQVIEGQYFTIECRQNFRADDGIAPLMTWKGPGLFQTAYIVGNQTVWSGVQFTVNRTIDSQHFECKTNFTDAGFQGPDRAVTAPSWTHIFNSNTLHVNWAPTAMYADPIQSSYEIGQSITCYADANPAPVYIWENVYTSEIFNGNSFTVTEDMIGYQLFRCQAQNIIRGLTYTNDFYLDVFVNQPTTSTTPAPSTTTTSAPEFGDCSDVTGRWESVNPNASMCLIVDHSDSEGGRLTGLFLNGSNTFWMQLTGRTRENKYDELGWILLWPSTSIGVSSFAAECHRCYGTEVILADVISRSTKDSEYCASGGQVNRGFSHAFYRAPLSWPCSTSFDEMLSFADEQHLSQLNKQYNSKLKTQINL